MARRARRSRPLLAVLALGAGALAACNMITGLDKEYSADARDGAASVGEGGIPDGPGNDGQTADGSMLEAGNDGSLVLSFCEKAKGDSADVDFFCTDFENGLVIGSGGWTDMENANDAGKLRVTEDAGMDASHALEVTATSTTIAAANTHLRRTLSPMEQPYTYKSYEVDFDVFLAESTMEYEALGVLLFAPTDVSAREHGIAGYGPSPHYLSRQATGVTPSGTEWMNASVGWMHARVTLDHASATAPFTRTIVVGAAKADTNTTGHIVDAGAPTDFRLGVFYTPTKNGTAHVYFDNVVVRRRPF